MANTKVDLSWSQLRPRRTLPDCVLRAIPPNDLANFVRNLARHPLQPHSEAIAIRTMLLSLRQHRCDHLDNKLINNPFSMLPLPAKSLPPKRRRDPDRGSPPQLAVSSGADLPRRKQRRAAAAASAAVTSASSRSPSPSTNTPRAPGIGSAHQAEVPPFPSTRPSFTSVYTGPLPTPYFSPFHLSSETIDSFHKAMTQAFSARDGLPPGPFAIDFALPFLMQTPNDISGVVRRALLAIKRGPYFPGLRAELSHDEHCLFSRALAEGSKNFGVLARTALKDRTSHELVWMYYALYKQTRGQKGISVGIGVDDKVVDEGLDRFRNVHIAPERIVAVVRSLARTAADGFPVDARVVRTVLQFRNKSVQQERRRRETETLPRTNRTRQMVN